MHDTSKLEVSKVAQQLDWRSIAWEIGGCVYEFSATQSTWQESGLAKLPLPAKSNCVPKHSAKQTRSTILGGTAIFLPTPLGTGFVALCLKRLDGQKRRDCRSTWPFVARSALCGTQYAKILQTLPASTQEQRGGARGQLNKQLGHSGLGKSWPS